MLLKERPISGVLFARALLHSEHQLGACKGYGYAIDYFRFDSVYGIFKAHPTSLGHQVHSYVVIHAYDDPLCYILVAEFFDRTVWKNFERLLYKGLIRLIARNEQIDILRRAHKPQTVDGKSANYHVGDAETV